MRPSFGLILRLAVIACLGIPVATNCREKSMPTSKESKPIAFEPQVAGMFYPQDKHELATTIQAILRQGTSTQKAVQSKPLGIIVPHAGYAYSGPVAAPAFRAISGHRYKNVVVLASAHRRRFRDPALLSMHAYRTPLGDIPLNHDIIQALADTRAAKLDNAKFVGEHALEVELPFLQASLDTFHLIPIMISDPDPSKMKKLATALYQKLARSDTLIVASTDMSHDHAYDTAVAMDENAIRYIKKLDVQGLYTANQNYFKKHIERDSPPTKILESDSAQLCGLGPVLVLLEILKMTPGIELHILDRRNSGDIVGDKQSRIVGYFSAAALPGKQTRSVHASSDPTDWTAQLSHANKKTLLSLARRTLANHLESQKVTDFKPESNIFLQPAAAFVTLKKNGMLRGCIGHMEPTQPLWEMVRDRTLDAALRDPRFKPVLKSELKDIHIEISLLSPKVEVKNPLEEIELGRDGLWLEIGANRGVFLPQVPVEQGWKSIEEYLDHLCRKAHIFKPGCWRNPEARIHRFTALVFAEK